MTADANARVKRVVDVVVALLGLTIALPIAVLAGVAVKATSPGPALHRAERIGRGGSRITVHKLRSMRIGQSGTLITGSSDPRITTVGRILRSTKLDELPQLWDVLTGSMSLVGPRPEDAAYVDRYTSAQRRILYWQPGITSPASIAYRHEELLLGRAPNFDAEYQRISADKIDIDLAYFEHATVFSDLSVIARTVASILGRAPDPPHEQA